MKKDRPHSIEEVIEGRALKSMMDGFDSMATTKEELLKDTYGSFWSKKRWYWRKKAVGDFIGALGNKRRLALDIILVCLACSAGVLLLAAAAKLIVIDIWN